MERVDFDVQGARVTIEGDSEAVLDLAVHFGAYRSSRTGGPSGVRVTLRREPGVIDAKARLTADQILERGVVYNQGDVAWVDYHGNGTSRYDFAREEGEIRAPRVEDLVELGYLMVHSRLGVMLEDRGLVRLHALGLVVDGRAVLVLAPSGGGKSTLARAALRRTDVGLLGDDLVLVDLRGRVHGFHSPIGIPSAEAGKGLGDVRSFHRRHHPPKWIVDPLSLGGKLVNGPVPAVVIADLRRVSAGPSRVLPAPFAATARTLFRDMVVGLGLPQVLELVARRGASDLAGLLPSAWRRSRTALALLRSARGATLEVSDPGEALSLLIDAVRLR